MLLVPVVEVIDSWCFCHIFTSCKDHPKPLNSSKYHPVVPVSPRQQMDWLLVRLWCDERGLRRIFHWCLAFTVVWVVWNFSSLSALPSLWNFAAFPTSWKALGGGISALLLLTPPLSSRVQAWRVECNMWHLQFSIAYCFLIMVWRLCAALVVL